MDNAIRKNNAYIENEREKRKSTKKRKKTHPRIIDAYGEFLLQMNYSVSTINSHLPRAKEFINFYSEIYEIDVQLLDDFKVLTITEIIKYENYLLDRVNSKEIKDETAYSCIKNIRLFLEFLNYKKITSFNYKIPKKFIVNPKPLNAYIPSQLILELLQCAIADKSTPQYRSLAILSLIVDTGCRPVEVSNIKLHDLKLSERKITLHSEKSGKYTLLLDDFVIKVLKKYISNRKKVTTKSNHLFIKLNGEPISTTHISSIIYGLNLKAFGTTLINARAIRHTHITNAIDNNNDFKEISAAVGHKHWVSTLHYLHRSEKRLLANTLNFNPIMDILEEF
jgi:site-specific recombinase XerD